MVSGVPDCQVLVVSDTHLSSRTPEAAANWDAVGRYVTAMPPDLVVHVGDLTLDAAHHREELLEARRLLDGLGVPWVAVPGNHDIGDNPYPGAPGESTITADRLSSWLRDVGPDRWREDLPGWTLVGVNAQLFGSGLDAEMAQWSWLIDVLASQPSGRPIALVIHKPLTASTSELRTAPPYRFVVNPVRKRLLGLIGRHRVAIVVSGHVHQFRTLGDQYCRHIWAPTTWAVLPDDAQPVLGLNRCGVVSLRLAGDGQTEAALIEPEGMTPHTITDDIPDPDHA
jgi:Icc protein